MKTSLILSILVILVVACSKEGAPDLSAIKSGQLYNYDNTPLGKRLQTIYERTGSYILYQNITAQDWTWNFDKSSGANYRANGVENPDINVPVALDYMEQYWFRFYPDAFLKQYLPLRIIISDSIINGSNRYQIFKGEGMQSLSIRLSPKPASNTAMTTRVNAWADSTKKRVAKDLHEQQYIETIANKLVLELPEDFFIESAYDYAVASSSPAAKNSKELGFWALKTLDGNLVSPSKSEDVLAWLKAIASNKPDQIQTLFTYTLAGVPVVSAAMVEKYKVIQAYLLSKYNLNMHNLNQLYF